MGCNTLVNLSRECNRVGTVGGVRFAYMLAFKDAFSNIEYNNDNIFTLSSGGLVIAINNLEPFVKVEMLPFSGGLSENVVTNTQTGGKYFEHTFNMSIASLSVENKAWIDNVLGQPVIIIAADKNKKYHAIGLHGFTELTGVTGGTGTQAGDLNGYALTFAGTSLRTSYPVDPTLIPELINPVNLDALDYISDFAL